MAAVTQWFPTHIKPARAGFYQRDWSEKSLINHPDYFDGECWWIMSEDLRRKLSKARIKRKWRGLAEKPV